MMSFFSRGKNPEPQTEVAVSSVETTSVETTSVEATAPDADWNPATSESEVELTAEMDTLPANQKAASLATAHPAMPGSAMPGSAMPAQAVNFEEIVERYHGKVFQLIYRYTGDYEESCDLTQDTFVRAFAAWNEFRGDSQIFTWLYRIAINLCHNHQKKVQRRRLAERISLDAPLGDDNRDNQEGFQVADDRPLPLQVLESCELRVRLQEALLELPENYRTVIVLRDIEGLTYEEIARVTDSTLEAIKSRLFRARNAVRRLMEPYLQGPLPGAATLDDASWQNVEISQNTTPSRAVTAPRSKTPASAQASAMSLSSLSTSSLTAQATAARATRRPTARPQSRN